MTPTSRTDNPMIEKMIDAIDGDCCALENPERIAQAALAAIAPEIMELLEAVKLGMINTAFRRTELFSRSGVAESYLQGAATCNADLENMNTALAKWKGIL